MGCVRLLLPTGRPFPARLGLRLKSHKNTATNASCDLAGQHTFTLSDSVGVLIDSIERYAKWSISFVFDLFNSKKKIYSLQEGARF
jgi:hypothetical protein